jgi:membrane protein YdbS with pleckstrin-like domain
MAEPLAVLRGSVARWLKVPPEPEPPAGATGSLRRFRAARNYLKYRLVLWGLKQVAALWGLFAGLFVVTRIDEFPGLFNTLEVLAWVGFTFQLLLSLTLVFLDWDLRWYLVTDRSLRIREGVGKVTEKTQSFANIQNLSIRRGPLQRLLGIADLEVKTAGGGGGQGNDPKEVGKEDLHSAYFRGVDNAEEIRDVILARLRRFRDAGLGDPDEPSEPAGEREGRGPSSRSGGAELEDALRAAVRDLVDAARGLHTSPASGS